MNLFKGVKFLLFTEMAKFFQSGHTGHSSTPNWSYRQKVDIVVAEYVGLQSIKTSSLSWHQDFFEGMPHLSFMSHR